MKKIYFFIFMMLTFLITTGQEFKNNLPYASYREGVESNPLKSAEVPGTFTQKAVVAQTESMIDALLITADEENWITDVQTYLMNTGKFNVVDIENYTTPTLATLRNYDAVLVWANSSLNNTIGDTLAAYIDEGGGVVSAVFNLFESWGITGTRFNTDYLLLNLGDYTFGGTTTLGTVYDTGHPLMDGVTSLTNPNEYRSNNATMTAGSEVIAEWSDGLPLVVVKENLGPANARRADVNIFPPSSNVRDDLWDAATDGDILLANALLWVSQTCYCADVVVNSDPGTCGAVVDYTLPTPDGATVNQIDASGLSSGDEFPVGSTIQQYEFDFGGGDLDTCTFNVIVNDTEPPAFTCPEDITVYAAPGETCAVVNFPDLGTVVAGEAQPGITLPNAPSNQAGVAYNPDKKLYYAVQAGSPNYFLYTYDETGVLLTARLAGFDSRGLWWNPNTSSLEGSSYAGNGYRRVDLDTNGYALSTGTNSPASNYQPNVQSVADYDYDLDEVIYYNNNSIYRTSRATGALIGSAIPITGLPANTLNSTFVGYTGIPGEEVLIYDYSNKAVYFVDKTTGVYSHSVQLPVSAPGQNFFNASYSNGHIWISDGTLWHSYKILESGASDNCSAVTVTYSHVSGSCFPVGTTEVTLTATDAAGNSSSCGFSVTVIDTTPLVAECGNFELFLDNTGKAFLSSEMIETNIINAGYDINGIELISIDKTEFTCSDLGENTVTITVTDNNGNTSTCNPTVFVRDNFVPVISLIDDIEIEVPPGVCETSVEYPDIAVSYNCFVNLELIEGLGKNGMFPLGTTTETWQATNAAGQSSTRSFTVTVTTTNALPTIDEIADVVADKDSTSVLVNLTGISRGIDCQAQEITVTAETDNNELITMLTVIYTSEDSTGTLEAEIAPETFGTANITVTVEDSEGGMVTETFALTVNPVNNAPFLVAPVADQTVNANRSLKIPLSSALGEMFDDIDGDALTISVVAEGTTSLPEWATFTNDTLVGQPMIADTGCVNIVVTATDAFGATASDTFEICVDGFPVGTSDLAANRLGVKLYPNPTNGLVTIELSSGIHNTELSVMDIAGRIVLRKSYSASERLTFNMSGKVAGMYFVKMDIDGNQFIEKLIVKD